MIICHKYKFIFIKSIKTAGTSIEIGLSKFCDENDIITPISEKDELLRADFGGRKAQNCYKKYSEYNMKNWFRLMKGEKKLKFYNHMPAKKVKTFISEDVWNNYFKFSFVRNPWDAAVSLHFWKYKDKTKPPLAESIRKNASLLKKQGHDIYKIDGEIVVDKIYKYEELDMALEDLTKRLGLPAKLDIPRAKSSQRTDKRHYAQLFTLEDKVFIEKLFEKEIKMFGYSFEE